MPKLSSSVRNRLPASALLQVRQRARSEQLQYLQGAFEIKAKTKVHINPTQCTAVYLAISAVHSFATPMRWLWGGETSTQTLGQSMQATDTRHLP